jgi:hypothetical protein
VGILKKNKILAVLILASLLILLVATFSHAQPISAEGINVDGSERKPASSVGLGVGAQAGNVTQLSINDNSPLAGLLRKRLRRDNA